LIASDVASRGLDIPGVMHVIHYQIPRSAEIYVHRSGRTARSSNEGLSVMLVSPEEMNLYRKTLKTFTNKEIRDYPIDTDYYEECKKRVTLARKVDELQHQMSKEKSNVNWYEKHARMLDMELDDEIMKETHVDSNQASKNQRKLSQFKNELNQLLNKMMFPKYVSKNYLESQTYEKVMSMNSKSFY
jgi:ATP-dependent RNA helicase DDX24/MAK5